MALPKGEVLGWVVRSGLLLGGLLTLFPLMLVAIAISDWLPGVLTDLMFFAPQVVFPTGWRTASPSPVAVTWWSLPIWLLVVLGFGPATRRLPLRWAAIAAIAALVLVTIGLHLAMPLLGFTFQLDGL